MSKKSKKAKRLAQQAVDQAPTAEAAPAFRRMNPATLAALSVDPRKAQARTPFVMPQPMAGVVPHGADMAMDDCTSNAFDYANSSMGGMFSSGMAWPGFPMLAELSQMPEYRRLSEVVAREMTRRWISFTSNSDDDDSGNKLKQADKIKQLEKAFDKFHVQDLFRRAAELDGFFGRAQLFIDTGYTGDSAELVTPLMINSKKIKKGGLKRLTIVEPLWSSPSSYNSSQPLAPHFYEPQEWFVMGQKVHTSRLLTFVGREIPTFLRAAYSFSGLSLTQMAKSYVENFLRTRDSVSELVHSFSVSGIKMSMAAALQNGDAIIERATAFTRMRDNRGVMMLNSDEEFFNVSTPLGTLDHLLAQSQEQIASICGLPLLVLLGISPAGLNATSDGEIRVFYDSIHAQQEHLFRRHLDTVMKLIMLNEWGEVDEDIIYRFEPLWQPNEAEQAAIRKTDIDAAIGLIGAGVIDPVEERQRLANAEGSSYSGLDVSDVPEPPESEEDPLGGGEAKPAESKSGETPAKTVPEV